MTVTDVRKDPDKLTLTITADLDAGIERAWQLWADPRQLERWWGPPGWPATFVDHDLSPGSRCLYYMSGPDGEKPHGWWEIVAADAPTRLELRDGFADADGNPSDGPMTTSMVMTLTPRGDGGTTMSIESRFPSLEVMEQMAEMGMVEGITQAINQIDGILAGSAAT